MNNNQNIIQEVINKHQEKGVPFLESIFRAYSKNYFETIREAKRLYTEGKLKNIHEWDKELFESDFGSVDIYKGRKVPLDLPIPIKEAEYQGKNVQLSKPMRNSGGGKKFKVYVKDPSTGNVKKVSFGAAGGGGSLAVKLKDPAAKKSFAARHNCESTKDKTTAGYWACRLPRYAKSLGLSGGGTWW